jgi:hypothetical protein
MARTGIKWDDECCAVHDGTIGSFDALRIRIKNITEWKLVTKRKRANIARLGKIAGGSVAVGLVATGAGAVLAPAAGGAIGAFKGLSGATAIKHGLAILGRGALAAGGFGVKGGTAVIAVGTGMLGGVGGGVLVNKYVGEIDGFDIKTHRRGSGTQIIFINGLGSQSNSLLHHWKPTLQNNFGKNTWYELEWESKRRSDLGKLIRKELYKRTFRKTLEIAAKTATKQAAKKLSPAFWLSTVLELGRNPWLVALSKAQKTGQLLADLILRADGRARYVLLGHSLGARVIYYTLQALAEADVREPRIREAHLLGGAVGRDRKSWTGIDSAVSGQICNYYSKNDDMLRVFYKVGTLFTSKPVGRGPIIYRPNKIRNVDVTGFVGGHDEYKQHLPEFICQRQ